MSRVLLPFFFLATAIAIFYFLTDPIYQEAKALETEKASYDDALDNSKKLQAVRDKLLTKYSSFPALSVERLSHMLPNNVDNVRLILEIDRIAAKYGMSIKGITLSTGKDNEHIGEAKPYGTVQLTFTVDTAYRNFLSFLNDLEHSLRVVDIDRITFSTVDDKSVSGYTMTISTYWLK